MQIQQQIQIQLQLQQQQLHAKIPIANWQRQQNVLTRFLLSSAHVHVHTRFPVHDDDDENPRCSLKKSFFSHPDS